MHHTKHFRTRNTPQNSPIPGTAQVANSAGGYAWELDDWARLDRFLILDTEGGTYYVSEHDLTIAQAQATLRCIQADGVRAVKRIQEISFSGRAHKNNAALFALAMAAGMGDELTRQKALEVLPDVARTGTHLFTFLEYVQAFRGWGRALRRGVGNWYLSKQADRLAYQVIKYRQRNGWTHADVLRLAHPEPTSAALNAVFKFVVDDEILSNAPQTIHAFAELQRADSPQIAAHLIHTHNLPREAVPTQFLNDPVVWEALLENMPITAMIRNLGKMGSVGILDTPVKVDKITGCLTDNAVLQGGRVHPIQVLAALITYTHGRGMRGALSWPVLPQIKQALNEAFYKSFGTLEPTGLRHLLALDVSGSMGWRNVSGVLGLTPRVAAAAMSMITARTEPQHTITAFSLDMVDIPIRNDMPLDQVVKVTENIPMGGTDCALPMVHALNNGLEIDVFVVYTDSETWAGSIHPAQALQEYRNRTGIPAKLVVVGMEGNSFTIADPNDAGMLDVVGFDTATPAAMREFSLMGIK